MPKDMNNEPIDATINGRRRTRNTEAETKRQTGLVPRPDAEANRTRHIAPSCEEEPTDGAPAPEDPDPVKQLQDQIHVLLEAVPKKLRKNKPIRKKCRNILHEAEQIFEQSGHENHLSEARNKITEAKGILAEYGELDCPWIVAAFVASFFAFAAFAIVMLYDAAFLSMPAGDLNKHTFMGIPVPVIFWSVIGSLTSIIINAGRRPIANFNDALLLLFSRPIAGIVMGILCYLMLAAGLLAMTGSDKTQLPQLLWVTAFAGSFIDTLSERLLKRFSNGISNTGDDAKAMADAQTLEATK